MFLNFQIHFRNVCSTQRLFKQNLCNNFIYFIKHINNLVGMHDRKWCKEYFYFFYLSLNCSIFFYIYSARRSEKLKIISDDQWNNFRLRMNFSTSQSTNLFSFFLHFFDFKGLFFCGFQIAISDSHHSCQWTILCTISFSFWINNTNTKETSEIKQKKNARTLFLEWIYLQRFDFLIRFLKIERKKTQNWKKIVKSYAASDMFFSW